MDSVIETTSFSDFGLDDRLFDAITKNLKWNEPTLIQEKAIPLALEGKDILARARTGSGKTGAFLVPIIQQILKLKNTNYTQETIALILAPTRELCKQIADNVGALAKFCSSSISYIDVSPQVDLLSQRPLLLEKPDIIIGTPLRIRAHLHENNICLKTSLKVLVMDEADLMFEFNCGEEINKILEHLPNRKQVILMSATLSKDVRSIKKVILHNPVVLKLKESQLPGSDQLTQYQIRCEEEDKFVLIYALLKLGLVKGKIILFVRNVDRCYRLKLYLEQFGIRCCVLNSELPADCRCHAVGQFNAGVYDIIVASDEHGADKKPNPDLKKRNRDKEYGVSRGTDFQFATHVINFDFPSSVDAYIHRVGRTARGKADGTAISFVSKNELSQVKQVEEYFTDEAGVTEGWLKPFLFKMEELEGFRYRARDAYRAVTSIAVREARLKEIKMELINSKNLKSYFEDNPKDLKILRHDKALHTVKLDSHLHDVPDYIIPETLKNVVSIPVKEKKRGKNTLFAKAREGKASKKFKRAQKDPLKSFQFAGLTDLESRKKRKKM